MVGFFYLATLYASLRYWAAESPAGRNTWLALATSGLFGRSGLQGGDGHGAGDRAVVRANVHHRNVSRRRCKNRGHCMSGCLSVGACCCCCITCGPRSRSAGFHVGIPAYVWWFTQTQVLLMYLKLVRLALAVVDSLRHAVSDDDRCRVAVARAGRCCWPSPHWCCMAAQCNRFCRRLGVHDSVANFDRAHCHRGGCRAADVSAFGGTDCAVCCRRLLVRASGLAAIRQMVDIPIAVTFASSLAIVWSVVSIHHSATFHDELALWQNAVLSQPDDFFVRYNLGNELAPCRAIASRCRTISGSPAYQSELS